MSWESPGTVIRVIFMFHPGNERYRSKEQKNLKEKDREKPFIRGEVSKFRELNSK